VHAASRQAEADTIAAELAAIARTGMVLPGSITQRRTRCGRRNCGCHADPPRLHGPYWQWTRKVAAKTICRWLSDDQHRDYQPWIDNDRRLHALLTRLEALGTATFEADPRWQQRGRTSPAAPADQADVSTARLTCNQPSSQAPFPQVSPKREDLSQVRGIMFASHRLRVDRFVDRMTVIRVILLACPGLLSRLAEVGPVSLDLARSGAERPN